jgi:GTP cyclohydrolase I
MEDKKNAVKLLLSHFGEEDFREELKLTPERMLTGYKNILSGYDFDYYSIIQNNFSNAEKNDIILFEKIDFFSMCEHHIMPFFGEVQIAYIPREKSIGFGTVAKLVEAVTRRLQLQERVGREIGEIIQSSLLNPLGVFVSITGHHFCVLTKPNKSSKPSLVKTLYTTGDFKEDSNLQKLSILMK